MKIKLFLSIFLFYSQIIFSQSEIEFIKSEAMESSISDAYVASNDSIFVYYVKNYASLRYFEIKILNKKSLKTIANISFDRATFDNKILSSGFNSLFVSDQKIFVFGITNKNKLFVLEYSLKGKLLNEVKYLNDCANHTKVEFWKDLNKFYVNTNNRVFAKRLFDESEWIYDINLNFIKSYNYNNKPFSFNEEFTRCYDNGKIYILKKSYYKFLIGNMGFYPIKDEFTYLLCIMDENFKIPYKEIPIFLGENVPSDILSFSVKNGVLNLKSLFRKKVSKKKSDLGVFVLSLDINSNKILNYKEKIIDIESIQNQLIGGIETKINDLYFIDVIDMPDKSQRLIFEEVESYGIYGNYMNGNKCGNIICMKLVNEVECIPSHVVAKNQIFNERFLEIEPKNKYKEYNMGMGVFSFVIDNNIYHLYNDLSENSLTNEQDQISTVRLRKPKKIGTVLAKANKENVRKSYVFDNKNEGMMIRFDQFKDNFQNFRENRLLSAISLKNNQCYLILIKSLKK